MSYPNQAVLAKRLVNLAKQYLTLFGIKIMDSVEIHVKYEATENKDLIRVIVEFSLPEAE